MEVFLGLLALALFFISLENLGLYKFVALALNINLCIPLKHRLNMELDLQSLFGLHVHSCTH